MRLQPLAALPHTARRHLPAPAAALPRASTFGNTVQLQHVRAPHVSSHARSRQQASPTAGVFKQTVGAPSPTHPPTHPPELRVHAVHDVPLLGEEEHPAGVHVQAVHRQGLKPQRAWRGGRGGAAGAKGWTTGEKPGGGHAHSSQAASMALPAGHPATSPSAVHPPTHPPTNDSVDDGATDVSVLGRGDDEGGLVHCRQRQGATEGQRRGMGVAVRRSTTGQGRRCGGAGGGWNAGGTDCRQGEVSWRGASPVRAPAQCTPPAPVAHAPAQLVCPLTRNQVVVLPQHLHWVGVCGQRDRPLGGLHGGGGARRGRHRSAAGLLAG